MNFDSLLWVLLLGSLLGLELIGKVPPTLHTPLMSGANAISGITMLAALTAIIKAEPNSPLLIIGSISLGFALFNKYFAPVLSKPSVETLREIFKDNDQGESGYIPD